MIKKIASLLLLFSFTAQAGLPPTTIKGQSDASPVTTFNLQVPGSGITRLGGPNALIETGYKNYIQDPGAENPNGPTVWATYANTAQATPVTGSGGSPTVTWTRTTSSPLRGKGSFLFTKTAVNSMGQGASYDFTTDNADQAKVLNVSFDYAVASGTYQDADLTVYLYDKTNSQIIQPAGFQILSAATGLPVKQVSTTFQTASNSTSYRLIFHVASTSASAYTVKFDNITVGPQIITQGTPVTDWQSYTPIFSAGFGAVTNASGQWRRVGKNLEVVVSASTGTTASILATASLPPGLSIDPSSLTINNTSSNPGTRVGSYDNSGANPNIAGSVVAAPATNPSVFYFGSAGANSTSHLTPATADVVTLSSDTFSFHASVPIVGWSSQVQMSDSASTAPMEAKVYLSGNVTSSGTAWTVPFDSVSYDTAGAFNTTSHGYVVPKPGYWEVKLTSNLAGGNTGSYEVYKNGSPISDGPTNNVLFYQGSANNVMSGSLKVKCSANDVLTVVSTATGANIIATGTFATFSQSLGPSQVASSENVYAKYATAGAYSTTTGQPINFATKTLDSHGAVTTGAGSWKFTAPASGVFQVCGTFINSSGTQTVTVYKNGSSDTPLVSPDATHWSSGCTIVSLLATEYIDARLDATQNITGYITVQRTGN